MPNITPDLVNGVGGWSRARRVRICAPGRCRSDGGGGPHERVGYRSAGPRRKAGEPGPVRDPADQVAAWDRGKPFPAASCDNRPKSGAQRSSRIAFSSAPSCPPWLASTVAISER